MKFPTDLTREEQVLARCNALIERYPNLSASKLGVMLYEQAAYLQRLKEKIAAAKAGTSGNGVGAPRGMRLHTFKRSMGLLAIWEERERARLRRLVDQPPVCGEVAEREAAAARSHA